MSAAGSPKPDYGIDAPGIRRGMFIGGVAGLVVALAAAWVRTAGLTPAGMGASISAGLLALGLLAAVYGLFMGGYMTYSSRVSKLKTRERLLDAVGAVRPWKGDEAVLDVGCGRGLMVIGAAKRLQKAMGGDAVGIDLWRAEDQADNTPDAARRNAELEGVSDRVRIDTGDARTLPYEDSSFDVVLSHWVVHNVDEAVDRRRVLDEMLRVLRPGGVLALADIAEVTTYRKHLQGRGVSRVQFFDGGLEAQAMGVLSGGSFRPQALIAVRP